MVIEQTNEEVIFKVSKKLKKKTLLDIQKYIEYSEITAKSKASQKDIDTLVKKAKKGRWEKTKLELGL